VRKIDALTGAIVWEQKQICITVGSAKGGAKATPHIGHGTIGDLLICAFYGLAVDTTDADGNVLGFGRFPVQQNLATAPASYDPRSDAEKTLEAIEAKIAGRVLTLEQSQITIGDRSITYINSINELERWRDHFQAIVNREQGLKPYKSEVCFLKRV
jgi:hypothetical protein